MVVPVCSMVSTRWVRGGRGAKLLLVTFSFQVPEKLGCGPELAAVATARNPIARMLHPIVFRLCAKDISLKLPLEASYLIRHRNRAYNDLLIGHPEAMTPRDDFDPLAPQREAAFFYGLFLRG